jgi:hypothetical protein
MPRKMENQQLVSPLQCSSTQSVLFKELLGKNNVTTLQHPPYPTDVDAAGFYPFPLLESSQEGRPFCDATYIIKNGIKACFQHLYCRWQKCVAA